MELRPEALEIHGRRLAIPPILSSIPDAFRLRPGSSSGLPSPAWADASTSRSTSYWGCCWLRFLDVPFTAIGRAFPAPFVLTALVVATPMLGELVAMVMLLAVVPRLIRTC